MLTIIAIALYSDSVLDLKTTACFLKHHETSWDKRKHNTQLWIFCHPYVNLTIIINLNIEVGSISFLVIAHYTRVTNIFIERVYISNHIIFYETSFPFESSIDFLFFSSKSLLLLMFIFCHSSCHFLST